MRRWFTEPRTMVSSDHRSCGRSPIRGLLREPVRAYRISDGWIRRGQTGVRHVTDPVRPRRIHPSQIRYAQTASLRGPLISSDHSFCGQSSPSWKLRSQSSQSKKYFRNHFQKFRNWLANQINMKLTKLNWGTGPCDACYPMNTTQYGAIQS